MRGSDRSEKKILVVCHDFLPYAASLGSVMRIVTLADFLYKKGFEVNILASKGSYYGYFDYAKLCDKIKTFYIYDSQKKKNLNIATCKTKLKESFVSKTLTILKRFVSDFLIPDKGIRLIPRYYAKASKLMRQKGIRNVLISSPPHSTQLVGLLLKIKFGSNVNLIVDYRDSWNTSSIFSKKYILNRYISCRLEKSLLIKADRFLFVSEPMLAKIEKLHKIGLSDKSVLVMNGFSIRLNSIAQHSLKKEKIQIGYFGSVSDSNSSFRNIFSLLYCLKICRELSDKIEFHFYGPTSLKHYNIGDFNNLFLHKPVGHQEALLKMSEMDYLLLIHSDKTNSDEVITGKFFEYVSIQKPIICLAPENMEAVRLIKRYNIGIHIDINNNQEIIDKFLALNKHMDNNYSLMNINDFSREKQYEKILNCLI